MGCKNSQIRGVYISPLRFKVESLSGVFHICADWMGMFEVSFGWSNILHDSVQRVPKFWDSSGFGLKKKQQTFLLFERTKSLAKEVKNSVYSCFCWVLGGWVFGWEEWNDYLLLQTGDLMMAGQRAPLNVPPLQGLIKGWPLIRPYLSRWGGTSGRGGLTRLGGSWFRSRIH